MNNRCDDTITFATTASALATTADEAVSTARVAVAKFETDSGVTLSNFHVNSAAKLLECDQQLSTLVDERVLL